MTFDEKVSKVLERVGRGDRVNIFSLIMWHAKEGDRNQQRTIVSFMEGKDLIKKENDGHTIGHFGINVLKEYGSWMGYIEANETDKQKVERLSAKNRRFERRIKILNTFIAIVVAAAAVWTAYQTGRTETLTQQLGTVSKEVDSLVNVTGGLQNHLESRDKKIFELEKSLKSSRDSLRIKK